VTAVTVVYYGRPME